MTGWDPSTRGRTFPRTPNRRAEMAPPHSCLGFAPVSLGLQAAAVSTPQDSCMHPSQGLLLTPSERQESFPSHRHPKKEAAPPQGACWPKVGRPHTGPLPSLEAQGSSTVSDSALQLHTPPHLPSPSTEAQGHLSPLSPFGWFLC